ncbi:heavy metal translocating P-type ATPase [Sedimenticola selenatireducens]|uniref:Heavy metal translocating P-type ATPase n=1 Tax=Sedimenticola selenatireducens TaxID=191960 RepID=A0A2N6CWV1_9GAMM|nr:cation-translocating P-type ATPase [Sedimenticola selenatireducens]PLX61749.1 MAG: heavy metal translocating P-type ATPase [Sedimenticola selenatireducens]
MDCKLCGLPTPNPPVQQDGHVFCCYGCSTVYEHFGEAVLDSYKLIEEVGPVLPPEGKEAFLRIEGMHCASCEFMLKKFGERAKGVLDVTACYATSTAKVTFDPDIIDESDLPRVLSHAGYRAGFRSEVIEQRDNDLSLLRLLTGVSLSAMVMMLYLAFFYPSNLGLVPAEDLESMRWLAFYAAPRVMFLLTTVLIFYVGFPILRGAWIGVRAGALNMDNLLAIAVLAAYGYSIHQMWIGSHDLYFDVAAVIVTVVTAGRFFEKNAKLDATAELSRIISAWNPKIRVIQDEGFVEKSMDALHPGDRFVVTQGEFIPVNGTIFQGVGALDESLMTGEPHPVTRGAGAEVLGGTTLVEGELTVTVGESVESQMEALTRILWRAQSTSDGLLVMADRFARVFVPLVLVLAAGITSGLLLNGASTGTALLAGLATLIVSCPCTFGLAVPLTTAAAVSTALKHGIIIGRSAAYEKSAHIKSIALDKTGTLSTGKMQVTAVYGPPEVEWYSAAVERFSQHPVANAIARLDARYEAINPVIHPGKGAEALVDGKRVVVGSQTLFRLLNWTIPDQLQAQVKGAPAGGVVSYVGWAGMAIGAIVTGDQPRPGWKKFVAELRQQYRVVMLTGAERTDGYESAVDMHHAGVPPETKAVIVRQLREEGGVVMIGDGSNDGPALAAANLGIAFGVPTSLAADAADLIIPGDRLDRITIALDLLGSVRRRVHQNIGWALLYNAIAIPLALSGMLNPLFAALAMASSSILVVWNSSRSLEQDSWHVLQDEACPSGPDDWSRLGSKVPLETAGT